METIVVGVDGSPPAQAALEFAAAEAALRGARLRVVVEQAIATVEELQPSVECKGQAAEGQPAEVLLEASQDAGLIVVGNRGRGGFSSLLLGSVSQQVVHHGSGPVTVVNGTDDRARAPARRE